MFDIHANINFHVDGDFSFCLYPFMRKNKVLQGSEEQIFFQAQTSFHHDKQHGFIRSVLFVMVKVRLRWKNILLSEP